ncbi:MAG: hypothetical protein IJO64_02430 [Clostridia bacterium]|nr:hypothetical protein [Clostridia bacterium]MBQ9847896.1 hypothetical protein [Clostridia bacterium]
MKKTALILLALCFCLSLCACGIDTDAADDCALGFINGMLARDEEKMKRNIHPDHIESALPNDEFYKMLENYNIAVGTELGGIDVAGKSYADDTELEGRVIKCRYVARIDELFYNVDLVILDNDNGYGIVAASLEFCTDPRYYGVSGIEQDEVI